MELTTNYLGLTLPHPFITGASPACESRDWVRQVQDAGAAAIVLRSLFEEQIGMEANATHHAMESHAESFGEATDYFPQAAEFSMGPENYLKLVERTVEIVEIPVIASLNGVSESGWISFAKAIEDAGASAVELNLYYTAMDPEEGGADIESRDVHIVRSICEKVSIPVTVKVSPFFTSFSHFAREIELAGAKGMVLFNRFYDADIDIEELEMSPRLELSSPEELYLRLRWLSIISAQTNLDLAVTGGVHDWRGAAKAIMCGADAVQLVSALFRKGPQYIETIRQDLVDWMEEREYKSIHQMRDSMNLSKTPDPKVLARANYIRAIDTWM